MIYTYDTEFLEDGTSIDLISIGIVAEDGREYYAVASDADWDRIKKYRWLCDHVVPRLPLTSKVERTGFGSNHYAIFALDTTDVRVKPRWVIANEVRDFLLAGDGQPELWADYGAYDHVALCQLWGPMIRLPEGLPMWTNDLQQVRAGRDLPPQESGEHDALADARHVMDCLRHLGITRQETNR